MKFKRASGIILHPTSLPGPYGIGDLGPAAHRWVNWSSESGCSLWQLLPLGPTGYGDSPYQCFSAFAGNPYLISPDFLLRDDLLHPNDLKEKTNLDPDRVDYGRIIPWKLNLLERSFIRFRASLAAGHRPIHDEYDSFCADNTDWLEDYVLFMAIKEAHGGGAWGNWPEALRKREPSALEERRNSLTDAIQRFKFYQFLFFRQWTELREHAHRQGLQIIGDLPIFVAMDSADVWSHPELFCLDAAGRPTVVAGVPPDYFSPTGQLWGNPLYRWKVHKESGYAWWLKRLQATLKIVDIVRIDHFRGFAGYWEIPAGSATAEIGQWVTGPGADFFEVVRLNLGADLPIIAEDLGVITPDVTALRDQYKLPGMKVLQFAFSGMDNVFLPHHYPENCVVYTGTHDNDTARGWYASAPPEEKDFAHEYLKLGPRKKPDNAYEGKFVQSLIQLAWTSAAVFALSPMQDWLGLGTEARFNYPSKLGGNWEWRMAEDAMSTELQNRIHELNQRSGRLG